MGIRHIASHTSHSSQYSTCPTPPTTPLVTATDCSPQMIHKVWEWQISKGRQETAHMYELIDQIIEELQRNYTKYLTG